MPDVEEGLKVDDVIDNDNVEQEPTKQASDKDEKAQDTTKDDKETDTPSILDRLETEKIKGLEKSASDSKSRMHRATEEASDLRHKLDTIREENQTLKDKAIDDLPLGNEEAYKDLNELPEIKPLINDMRKVRKEVADLKTQRIRDKEDFEKARQVDSNNAFLNTIKSVHSDYQEILSSSNFKAWQGIQDEDRKEYYNWVVDKGSAVAINKMITSFKTTLEQTGPPSNGNKQPVNPRIRKRANIDTGAGQYKYTLSQLNGMSEATRKKHWPEIDKADQAGLIDLNN